MVFVWVNVYCMEQMDRINITLPRGLRDRAHNAGINISGISAIAVSRMVEISEKERTGDASAKTAPAVSSQGVTS